VFAWFWPNHERYSAVGTVARNIRKNGVKFTIFILTEQVKTEKISGLVPFIPFAESWEME
jgi:hypothetical protein